MALTHQPKQDRSRTTEERLLSALESLLDEVFFEQVSIKQLAARAGVAVGTVYRRFKDKDALLPVLYRRYDLALQHWVSSLWSEEALQNCTGLEARLAHLVASHVDFYLANRGMMRTLHLYGRLNGELSEAGRSSARRSQYGLLMAPVYELLPSAPPADQQRMLVLILVSSLTEALLYQDVSPAKELALGRDKLVCELTRVLMRYLAD